eukprot:CAMPEP_0170174574 /NCGR_PEP_ID=MMETSP0040_2-20121228/7794_1 /TAXON_ID=641309 /ORGANISM="Lotharella oceanica, Strain CCMP622" /LENGTH=39 /DNA_ID= /DNA_START= /DNA_END= /DNA_ORIENTATION=
MKDSTIAHDDKIVSYMLRSSVLYDASTRFGCALSLLLPK